MNHYQVYSTTKWKILLSRRAPWSSWIEFIRLTALRYLFIFNVKVNPSTQKRNTIPLSDCSKALNKNKCDPLPPYPPLPLANRPLLLSNILYKISWFTMQQGWRAVESCIRTDKVIRRGCFAPKRALTFWLSMGISLSIELSQNPKFLK